MTKIARQLLFAALIATAIQCPGVATEPRPLGWKLVWSDEFDGEEIDRTKWDRDVGNGFYNYGANTWISGWGNDELEYYTREPENAFVKGGHLHIRALKEPVQGFGYTSAKLKTKDRDGSGLLARKYGRFEIRAKLPTGQGIWPAIWMLPVEDKYGGWAASGEIDILEARGQKPGEILGTLHFGSRWPANAEASKTFTLPAGKSIAEFHDYALEWEPGEIRWFFDGEKYATQNSWWSSSKTSGPNGAKPATEAELNPWPAPFDQPFYLILNVAVGGKFLGNPDASTKFPAEMQVDYVRVFEKESGYVEAKPRGSENLPFKK